MPEKVIQTATTPDRIEFLSKAAKQEIVGQIGIKVSDLDANNIKKLGEQLGKGAKKVEFVINYENGIFKYWVRAGSLKIGLTETDVAADSSITDKEKVFKALLIRQVATQAQVDAFKNKQALPGLKKRIDELDKKIKEAEAKIKPDRDELERLRKEYKDKGGK